jgi:hypothetical protein
MNARRLLRPHIDAYRAALAECRADLAQMHFQHQCWQADLRRELEEVRAELTKLKAVVRARRDAEQELANLRALRDAEPTFGQPLN